jgi:hypothetical protein
LIELESDVMQLTVAGGVNVGVEGRRLHQVGVAVGGNDMVDVGVGSNKSGFDYLFLPQLTTLLAMTCIC